MEEIIKKKRGRPAKLQAEETSEISAQPVKESIRKEIQKEPKAHLPTFASLNEARTIVMSAVSNLCNKNQQEYNFKKENFFTGLNYMSPEEASLNGWFRYIELECAKAILATILANEEAKELLIKNGMVLLS